MNITSWINEDKHISFQVTAKPQDLLLLEAFFMDILNEFHFKQISTDRSGMRTHRIFIKKNQLTELAAVINDRSTQENQILLIVHQILFHSGESIQKSLT